jgi:hypothetical protein
MAKGSLIPYPLLNGIIANQTVELNYRTGESTNVWQIVNLQFTILPSDVAAGIVLLNGLAIGTLTGASTLGPIQLGQADTLAIVVNGSTSDNGAPVQAVVTGYWTDTMPDPPPVPVSSSGIVLASTAILPGAASLAPGIISNTTVTEPAPGADFTFSPGVVFRIVGFTASFTTSATPATRYPRLIFAGGLQAQLSPAGITEGQTVTFNGFVFGPSPMVAAGDTHYEAGIPSLLQPPSATLQSITGNLQAGDQWNFINFQTTQV